MAEPRVALVLLAAGRSARFGERDKLAAELRGLPLALHAARAAATLPFAARIAVTRASAPDFAAYGFTRVVNDDPAAGQGRSVALGVGAARHMGAEAVLVALADMPFVSAAHLAALLRRHAGAETIAASTAGAAPTPPALFGAAHFPALEGIGGDTGARRLLARAELVPAPAGELADVDREEDLARLAGLGP